MNRMKMRELGGVFSFLLLCVEGSFLKILMSGNQAKQKRNKILVDEDKK